MLPYCSTGLAKFKSGCSNDLQTGVLEWRVNTPPAHRWVMLQLKFDDEAPCPKLDYGCLIPKVVNASEGAGVAGHLTAIPVTFRAAKPIRPW